MSIEDIPHELRERPQWVLWRTELRGDKPTKVPYQVSGRKAQANNPATWGTFAEVTAEQRRGCDGIGYVFSGEDDFYGIDLDACRCAETGELTPWAAEIVETFGTYTEVSPSEAGVKLIARGTLPDGKGKVHKLKDVPTYGTKEPEIAAYDRARFWCITGRRLADSPPNCEPRQQQLDGLLAKWFANSNGKPHANGKHSSNRATNGKPHGGNGGAALEAMQRIKTKDGNDGSRRLLAYACRAVEFDLTDAEALETIRAVTQERPFPIAFSDADILERVRSAEQRTERGKANNSRDDLPEVHLPGGAVPITTAAVTLAELLGATGRYFSRGGVPMRIVAGDEQRLEPIRPAGLCSDIETVARPMRQTTGKEGETITAPATCPESTAKLILESAAFRSGLPPIDVVSRCPVLIERGGRLVEVTGYDRDSGILAAGDPTPDVPLAEAVELLRGAVADFRFSTLGDRARALASMITPGMVFGGLLGGRAPIDLGEADNSQAGKGYRNKVTAAIYREAPKPVTQRTGGVGGLQESFDSRVVAGAPFLVIDNFRGSVDCPFLESYMTEDSYSARIPYAAPAALDPRRTIVQFTSNAASTTVDAANRSSCVRILKQASGYQFTTFPEGDILDHVRANQPRYLGAVFSVVREWHRRGKPTLTTVDHDFRRWAKVLGYIVASILDAGDLLEGHRAAQQRISSPGLNWLRDVALAVLRAGQADTWLRGHNLLGIILEAGIATEGIDPATAEDDDGGWLRATQAVGRKLGKVFKGQERIDIDAVHVMRREGTDENHRRTTEYAFFPETPNDPE